MFDDTKEKWWPMNQAMISSDPELTELVQAVPSCMAWSGSVLNALAAEGYKDTHVHMAGSRTLSQIKASVDKVFLGYYADAVSSIRNAFETTNTLACVINDESLLEKWKVAKKKDYFGGGDFSPFSLREKAAEILKVDVDLQHVRYRNFCKLGTHPDNDGIFFFETGPKIGELQRCDAEQAKGILQEAALQSYLLVRALDQKRPDSFDTTQGQFSGIWVVEDLLRKSRIEGWHFGLSAIESDGWEVKPPPVPEVT